MKRSDMDMIAQDMLCIAERADGKGKMEGYYFCMHHNDGRKHLHHFIIPLEADLSRGTPLDQIQVEVVPTSITLKASEPKTVRCIRRLTKVMKGICPSCEMEIESVIHGRLTRFCKFCGQAVKWNE